MTGWYSITPAGPVAIGNLTPVGQNSGQVGCRWPPNGHHLAASLDLPKTCQLMGPFWHSAGDLYVPLPQSVYTLATITSADDPPTEIYRMQYRDGYWQVRPEHEGCEIEQLGARYLISGNGLRAFWKAGKLAAPNLLQPLPWQSLTLSHNSREDFQVKEEGGFFAEMTTLMKPGWSILVKVVGDFTPPAWSSLGAGGTPVAITALKRSWDWLEAECPNATGAVLLTGALWHQPHQKVSLPYPAGVRAYAADMGVPWQSWKKVRDQKHPEQRITVLTPGEWLTPAGAVYLWDGVAPIAKSGTLPDPFNRHVLGYGHLWLFEEQGT